MDTKRLERFATQSRRELLSAVEAQATAVLANGSVARTERAETVTRLEDEIAAHGRAHVIDKVAYTWFNRIIALRFMDAKGYTEAGVVSPAQGQPHGQPEILADAKRGNLDRDVVRNANAAEAIIGLLDGTRRSTDAEGEAYSLLLTEYCRYWHQSMPFMFEREGDYTELLVPTGLLADGSILSRASEVLTEFVCDDVEVIGWLYQFYISERKQEVFDSKSKRGAEEIPAATQLFTPHWIVRYLVENSLGRLWMLNRPASRLVDQMEYYIPQDDGGDDFLRINGPEELTVIDPACGSGHMLTYAFDLLDEIYREEGYAPSEIPSLILEHNLHGTEIDPRAGALAAFALTMKARSRDRRFLIKGPKPKVCVIEPARFTRDETDFLLTTGGSRDIEASYWNQFEQADSLGSLIQPDQAVTERLKHHLEGLRPHEDILLADSLDRATRVLAQAESLSNKYAIAVANPPYMGSSSMDSVVATFAAQHYTRAKNDLYAMFIERCLSIVVSCGFVAMVTQDSWMFLGAYAKYREWLLRAMSLSSLAHLGTAAFDTIGGEVVSTVAFVVKAASVGDRPAVFIRAVEPSGGEKATILKEARRPEKSDHVWLRSIQEFLSVPNTPVIYWATDDEVAALRTGPYLSDVVQAREGLATGSNDRFLRRWSEVSLSRIGFDVASTEESIERGHRWFPYQKGGSSRRWYGNFDYVVDWENDGQRQKENLDPATGRIRSHNYNGKYGFQPGFTWSGISGDGFAVRHVDGGFMFDAKGPMAFANRAGGLLEIEGFLNSSTATRLMRLLAPRLDFKLGHVLSLPVRVPESPRVADLVTRCIDFSRADWDSSEVSRDFSTSPLVGRHGLLADKVHAMLSSADEANDLLANAEQQLDSIFGEAYESIGYHVDRRLGDLAQADRVRSAVEDLVSFAVGCMFGRYSLDALGLILADQGATLQHYLTKVPSPTYRPDSDNVIPFVDDGWFEDDIVERFRQFLRVAFGPEHFDENLRFIEDSLSVRTLRDYFITKSGKSKFYDDHVQRYKKRPIYWMFSSPKGSFSALIYMHRYDPSTVSTVLNEYLREYRAKLEVALSNSETAAAGGVSATDEKEADRLRKVLSELRDYEHDVLYPLATQQIAIDLDDGVRVNYPKFYPALKKIAGLESSE